MNKHLLLSISVLFLSILAKSQTNVSGIISGNATWTNEGSPYILTGNVGVRTGYTLSIEPGVTIKRDGDYQILINGAVQINGTPEDSIQFVNGMNAPTNSKYFIEFQKSDLNKSSLSYISFQQNSTINRHVLLGAGSEFPQTNTANTGTLNITHSNLSNGYITTQAPYSIDSCIMNNGVINSSYKSESVSISNSRIVNSTVLSEYSVN